MKKVIVTILVIFSFGYCNAQNLVPNPSFEDTVYVPLLHANCPEDFSSISFDKTQIANGWSSYCNTPDYYNSCSSSMGVPTNLEGYQYAATGKAYCGVITYTDGGFYHESIGARLITPLVKGTRYYISFSANCGKHDKYCSNNLGLSFSTVEYNGDKCFPVTNHAAIYSSAVDSDIYNWIDISGSFIADSAYKYVIIGNFFDDASTKAVEKNSASNYYDAYYYIDDVCVSANPNECKMNQQMDGINNAFKQRISIYPNPAANYLNISLPSPASLTVTNLLGQEEVVSSKSGVVRQIDVSNYPNGIYFLRAQSGSYTEERKFVVQH